MTSVKTDIAMKTLGERLGALLRGGEVIELVGDVGAGKTTLVKGVGAGLGLDEDVQSPSFTISRVYQARDELELHHYDFYRLDDAGVMSFELAESIENEHAITVVEWGGTVQDVLPTNRLVLNLAYTPSGSGREITATIPPAYAYLQELFV